MNIFIIILEYKKGLKIMGHIYLDQPQFLIMHPGDMKMRKLMFIKKNGKATHKLGDISRHILDAELICISDEDKTSWIGNFAEGYGLVGVHFAKEDCRDASEEEVQTWLHDKKNFKYDRKENSHE